MIHFVHYVPTWVEGDQQSSLLEGAEAIINPRFISHIRLYVGKNSVIGHQHARDMAEIVMTNGDIFLADVDFAKRLSATTQRYYDGR